MNHKLEMHKLEKIRRDKLEMAMTLHKEVSAIDARISEHRKIYLQNNKSSDEATRILDGFSREEVRETISFMLGALSDTNLDYMKYYKDIDMRELLKDRDFLDFLIVQMGSSVIGIIKKRFGEVETIGNEKVIRTKRRRLGNNDNFSNRLFKKLTKKNVIERARSLNTAKGGVS